MIDHFCRFGIDRTFAVDRDRLEKLFHELQSQSHPDRHVTSGDERRDQALAESSDINSAYRVLRDNMARARHLVGLYGYEVGQQKNIPPTLLMTVMEAQEKIAQLEQARGRDENEKLIHELAAVAEELEMRRETLDDERRAIAKQWDTSMHADATENLSAQEKELLGRMSQLLAERAYLETLHLSVQAAQHGRPAFIQH